MTGDWDPREHERKYVRHTTTGDLGYLVRRDGEDKVRLDRGPNEVIIDFRPNDWKEETTHYPMSRAQLAQVAFEADKKLCLYLGFHRLAKRNWLNLSEEDRIEFVKNGPCGKVEAARATKAQLKRQMLWAGVMSALADLAAA